MLLHLPTWEEFNDILTNKIIATMVAVYAGISGVKGIALEHIDLATSVLGLISLLIAIVVGYLTIKNLRLKNKLIQQHLDEGTTEQLKEAAIKDLQR